MMEIEQVWEAIDRHASRLPSERVPPARAVGRTLAEPVLADEDQPPFDQSAMDGYALGSPTAGSPYAVVATIAAGESTGIVLREGEAARILTGAMVPAGAVAVARQEDCEADARSVRVIAPCPDGTHIRRRGGVARKGEVLLQSGRRILPGTAGLLAACGTPRVCVTALPSVDHLVTGDEVVPVGTMPNPGQIRDSNGPLIRALLGAMGIGVHRRALPDSAMSTREAVAASKADLLLISGGSGPGDRDYTRAALEANGFEIHCSSVNSRPGRPLIFASRGARLAFGLPGNPLSHFVCFHAFVRRALCRMAGLPPARLLPSTLRSLVRDPGDGRRSWLPARLSAGARGMEVRPLAWKHSGDLTPLAEANALILCGKDGLPPEGDSVAVLPAFDTMEAA